MPISYIDTNGSTTNPNATDTTKNTKKDAMSFSQEDFINLMVTELRNQDPTAPTSTTDIMNQVTQIQDITTTQMQNDSMKAMTDSLKSMTESFGTMSDLVDTMSTLMYQMAYDNTFQNACNLSGSYVYGKDAEGNSVHGIVKNAFIQDKVISLTLEDGTVMPYASLERVVKEINIADPKGDTTQDDATDNNGSTEEPAADTEGA